LQQQLQQQKGYTNNCWNNNDFTTTVPKTTDATIETLATTTIPKNNKCYNRNTRHNNSPKNKRCHKKSDKETHVTITVATKHFVKQTVAPPIIEEFEDSKRGNQNPHIEEEQTIQWPKEKVQTTIHKTYTQN
jgi:hypothetical protein